MPLDDTFAPPITPQVYDFLKEFADAGFSSSFLEEQGFQYALALQPSLPDRLAHYMRVAKTAVILALKRIREERAARMLEHYEEVNTRLHPVQEAAH